MKSYLSRPFRFVALAALLGVVLGGSASWAWFGSTRQAVQAGAPAPTATPGKTATSSAQTAVDAATSLQAATISAAAAVSPKIVLVQSAVGLGSGEIIDARGYIVTNDHVVLGTNGQQLAPPFTVTLPNGKTYPATVTGTDSADDLAVLKINAGTLPTIALGNSSTLRVGQFVLAVGNPLGYAQTVTFGVVSTLNRGVPEGGPANFLPDLIQTSAPINPGNSGGALVNLQGQLVGIPTLEAADPQQGGAAQGIGFAIPVNRVHFITQQLIASGKVTNSGRAYLGITPEDVSPQMQATYKLPLNHGVLVAQVKAGSPAAKAGLQSGEIIVGINGTAVNTTVDLDDVVSQLQPGTQVHLTVVRSTGATTTVTVTLGTLPVAPAP
ncbi:MAG TPA: trypsin-like peptidase domain-containing protein [Chloroflexota bacterium]|jgi:S1-C subfamily serine protease|nr:trypsin-like peptidase domain-containing protein [Chloroflexota bacterium]